MDLSLLEAFGFDASGSLKPDAVFLRVWPQFFHLQKVPLDQVQLSEGKASLTFKDPMPLPIAGLALTAGAGLGGSIQILTPDKHVLDMDDPFQSIAIQKDEIYVALALNISAAGGVAGGSGFITFGLSDEREFALKTYRRFRRLSSGAFPLFGQAMAETFHRVTIPETKTDLDNLDRDTVLVVGGTGTLRFSGSFGITSPVHQLAATSPIAGQVVAVNDVATFTAGCSFSLTGGYQTRLRRLESQSLEIGIYQLRAHKFALQLAAEAGVTAGVGGFDIAGKVIAALSTKPVVDVDEWRQALPGEDPAARDEQIRAFEHSLGEAVSTSIQGNLTDELSNLRSEETVFTFEVAASAADSEAGSLAILSTLSGDFRPLTGTSNALPQGIKQTSNVFTRTNLTKQKITINLLGLVNFVSVSKLARIAQVNRNAAGEITLVSDAADANRLQACLANVVGAKRIRALLSEDFLMQAAYKAVDKRLLPPDFNAKHTFFDIDNRAGEQKMRALLDVSRVLGLITRQDEATRLDGRDDFGRITYWLQSRYSGQSLSSVFLHPDGAAKSESEFETVGRQALAQLLAGEPGQEFRKLVADPGTKGAEIWAAMKSSGNLGNFNQIFGVPHDELDPRVSAAGADYLCITSWARAMHQLATTMIELRTSDQDISELRQQLRERMAEVVKHSGEHFGEPLGLLMVYLASVGSAGARVILQGAAIPPLTKSVGPDVLTNPAKA